MKKAFVLAAMMVVALFTVDQGQAITCGQVDSYMAPCLEFLRGGASPSPGCCTGVQNLRASTPTQGDRRAACECLKQAASHYTGIKPEKASQLPKACGVEIDVPISKDVDCSKIP
ncbi:Non-specific lipid-transfer protein [Melia azedarach]|uniref:Non-specific lipid-transfer protein n=1 Tax=Melia azedarach TaxID=155640 RepID=A0ACC1Z2J2_MELAZ|nr:Non-specific lipid-transfer protein [Melia azedarach]